LAKERARKRRFDRRALLQRTRRSPIRPRRSRVEASARTVSPAKPVGREATEEARVFMAVLIQEQAVGGKWDRLLGKMRTLFPIGSKYAKLAST
jgi:hypothetical protein